MEHVAEYTRHIGELCLLNFLSGDCRNTAKQAWLEYAAGTISLTVASVTMETAIGLMRLSNEEFVKDFPGFSDWWLLPSNFSFNVLTCGKATYVYPKDVSSTDPSLHQDLIQLLCPAAACLLQEVSGYMKTYAETKHGQELLQQSKLSHPLLTTLMEPRAYDFAYFLRSQSCEFLSWVRSITKYEKSTQSCERPEFCVGIAEYYVSGKLPLWLVLACAMHMDMYEVIGDDPGCAIDAYIDGVSEMETQVHAVRVHIRKSDAQYPFPDLVKDLKPMFRQMHGKMEGLRYTEKTIRDTRRAGFVVDESKVGIPSGTCWGSPCILGTALNSCKWRYHYVGLQLANDSVMVLAMASLYSALRTLGLLKTTWQDMVSSNRLKAFRCPSISLSSSLPR